VRQYPLKRVKIQGLIYLHWQLRRLNSGLYSFNFGFQRAAAYFARAHDPAGDPMTDPAMPTNEDIADTLGRIADLLEAQDGDRYRVIAYRRAAKVISELTQSAAGAIQDSPHLPKSLQSIYCTDVA
jgi:hypothetical protein